MKRIKKLMTAEQLALKNNLKIRMSPIRSRGSRSEEHDFHDLRGGQEFGHRARQ
jgi:hypothetical protein